MAQPLIAETRVLQLHIGTSTTFVSVTSAGKGRRVISIHASVILCVLDARDQRSSTV
jgi:hypothetical protein